MKDHVVPFKVSAEFAEMVSDLSAGEVDQFKRLCPEEIVALSAATSSTTPAFLQTILSSAATGTSGDVYAFRKDNYYGLVSVREGTDNQGDWKMKTDPFIIETDATGFLPDHGYACYHADCSAHHVDPVTYSSYRDELIPGEPYELSLSGAGVIYTMVSHVIKVVNDYLSNKDNSTK